jgi:hypothetical protein
MWLPGVDGLHEENVRAEQLAVDDDPPGGTGW